MNEEEQKRDIEQVNGEEQAKEEEQQESNPTGILIHRISSSLSGNSRKKTVGWYLNHGFPFMGLYTPERQQNHPDFFFLIWRGPSVKD